MNPKQLEAHLARADLNQSTGAAALGISPRQMRRYIAGETEIPHAIELALHYLERHPDTEDSMTDAELDIANEAKREIRQSRPGKRLMTVIPMRNAIGEMVEVRFMWSDSPGRLLAGLTVRQPDGNWQTEFS